MASPHPKSEEAEGIHIFREVAATFERPVMPHSAGKGSAMLPRRAIEALSPSKPPFRLLHVDTGRQIHETIAFLDLETLAARTSEGSGRPVGGARAASAERTKVEGYSR